MSFIKKLFGSEPEPGVAPSTTAGNQGDRGALRLARCSACGKEIQPAPADAGPYTGPYTPWVCIKCQSVFCLPCTGWRHKNDLAGPSTVIACPKCGGAVDPLYNDVYPDPQRASAPPKAEVAGALEGKTAVRILIAHTGTDLADSDAREIIKHAWRGRVAPDVKITSRPVMTEPTSSNEKFASVWLMWQQMLQHQYGEHPYWQDHKTFVYAGTIVSKQQRFYMEIYYKE